jgi:hypothetical protein
MLIFFQEIAGSFSQPILTLSLSCVFEKETKTYIYSKMYSLKRSTKKDIFH